MVKCNEDKYAIDSDHEFIKDPLINVKTDLDSSSEDSDIFTDDTFIQDNNNVSENSGEENEGNSKDDVYSRLENISTNYLKH